MKRWTWKSMQLLFIFSFLNFVSTKVNTDQNIYVLVGSNSANHRYKTKNPEFCEHTRVKSDQSIYLLGWDACQ
jgi:hypothetical protein